VAAVVVAAEAAAVCDDFFSPNTITATHGNSVTFTWKGHIGHNVTFLTGPTSPTGSATMSSGQFTTQALSTGTYTFECTIHGAAMQGTINVN
jgi:plastocyanin